MKAKQLLSYFITAAMLAGTVALPATASAHGYRGDGYYYRDYGRRHHPAPKWRRHRGHARMDREYYYAPRLRVPAGSYIRIPGVRLGPDRDVDIIYRGYRDYWD